MGIILFSVLHYPERGSWGTFLWWPDKFARWHAVGLGQRSTEAAILWKPKYMAVNLGSTCYGSWLRASLGIIDFFLVLLKIGNWNGLKYGVSGWIGVWQDDWGARIGQSSACRAQWLSDEKLSVIFARLGEPAKADTVTIQAQYIHNTVIG